MANAVHFQRAGLVLAISFLMFVAIPMSGASLLYGCDMHQKTGAAIDASGTNAKAQTTCPVMAGNPINKEIYADHDGKRVYFCCAGCIEPFKKNPEKYLKKMKKAGEEPEVLKL